MEELICAWINAQCGISEDEDYTSIGAILRLSGNTFSQMVGSIIDNALARRKGRKSVPKVKKTVTRTEKRLIKQG